jgi:hypothetical protein
MQTLTAVEEAKVLLTEGMGWSILRWLTEKRRVRQTADKGTAALDDLERQVKSGWSEELKSAYATLIPPDGSDDPYAAAEYEFAMQQAQSIPESIKTAVKRVKEADDIATHARLTAEQTFDDAERRLSASMARRGAEQAVEAYDLRYRAIAEAEAVIALTLS